MAGEAPIPAGNDRATRPGAHVERRPAVGVGVVVAKGDEILLIRRHGVHGAGTWSTPGGHLDWGEAPEACARREVREETGVEIDDVAFLGITSDLFDADDRHYVTLWFTARHASGEATVAAPDEMSEVGWFDRRSLPTPLFLSLRNLLDGRGYPAPGAAPNDAGA